MPGPGRPPKPSPRWQDTLTLRQVLRYIREQGGRMSYGKLHRAIATGQLPAFEDLAHHDRCGRPLLVTTKAAVDAWLCASLRPIQPSMAFIA